MVKELRKTGIDVVGDVPWGTHFCQLYETRKDLVDTLVPFFGTGLENGEFCFWVTSEPLKEQDAVEEMRAAVPGFDGYLEKGQIRILPHTGAYLTDGKFDRAKLEKSWTRILEQAGVGGYCGCRMAGNMAWLDAASWRSFVESEAAAHGAFAGHRIIAVCPYPVGMLGPAEVAEVLENHEFALIKRGGEWKRIESSERRRMKNALRRNRRLYRLLADNVSDVIWVTDLSMRCVYLSPSVKRLRGYTVEEALTHSLEGLLPPDSLEVAVKAYEEQMALERSERKDRSRSWTIELEVYRGDGSTVWTEDNVTFLRSQDGDPIGLLGVARDISDRKRAETELRYLCEREGQLRERLEAEVRKRTEFTRALAHELKTPLTAVVASASALVATIEEEGFVLDFARHIYQGASRLNERIDELLDVARGEVGILRLSCGPVNTSKMLNEIAEEAAALASTGGQRFVMDMPPDLPVIEADENRLRQVILNLLGNTFRSTPEGGDITLKARREDRELLLEVQDTGPGISREEQLRLFEPYQIVEGVNRRQGGLGLGLALSKMLVELHGGRMWVDSQEGRGSTFGLSIPLPAGSDLDSRQHGF